jgi:Zn-dependent protease
LYGLYVERDETIQIIISVLAISFAFAIVFAGVDGLMESPIEFFVFMAPLLVTVGSGFILHEMAHKLVAIYYGAQARFRMWTQGIIFMLATSVIGILFAAPGAVYIYSKSIKRHENGLISLAGPVLNVILVFFFLALAFFAPINQYFSFLLNPDLRALSGFGIIDGSLNVWHFGASINLILALFNMIPAFPLDGSKVFAWNKLVWLTSIGFLLGFGSWLIGPSMIISFAILLVVVLIFSKLVFG